jgi:hypothetical protein
VVAAGIDERAVADADAEHEAARVGLAKGSLSACHGHGVPRPDVGDAAGDHHLPAGAQQQRSAGQRLPPEHLPEPQRPPAQGFQFGDRFLDLLGGLDVQLPGPQPNAAQLLGECPAVGGGLPLPVHVGPLKSTPL